jgi:hypothetical protein
VKRVKREFVRLLVVVAEPSAHGDTDAFNATRYRESAAVRDENGGSEKQACRQGR